MSAQYALVNFDPIALQLGPLALHWYGITYLLGFAAYWLIQKARISRHPWLGWNMEEVSDFMFYGMLGVIVGGRVGYVLFYSFDSFLADPVYLFRIWDGGMSFHGGILGVAAAVWWFGRKTSRGFVEVADFVIPAVPVGLAFGRLGNFIGGELWGRISDVPWAMIFPGSLPPGLASGPDLEEVWKSGALDDFARHPSQLYQAGLEGFALLFIMLLFAARPRPVGAVSGLFMLGYGCFRAVAEFFREPDAHIGYLAGDWLTMGIVLSLPMIALGLVLLIFAYRNNNKLAVNDA